MIFNKHVPCVCLTRAERIRPLKVRVCMLMVINSFFSCYLAELDKLALTLQIIATPKRIQCLKKSSSLDRVDTS